MATHCSIRYTAADKCVCVCVCVSVCAVECVFGNLLVPVERILMAAAIDRGCFTPATPKVSLANVGWDARGGVLYNKER